MSKKKRDHDWGENGFEDWVSILYICNIKLLIFIIIFIYF